MPEISSPGPEPMAICLALKAVDGGVAVGGVLARTSLVTKGPHHRGEAQAPVCWVGFPSLLPCPVQTGTFSHVYETSFIVCLPAPAKGRARALQR